ncbi:uncharacterized protein LOC21388031 [Morus notabilis]|uniref:uncharacterized protein LOC21388031 n=1 Tax=Morus notabilis TaxID=981085 RepID=UPI000CED4D2C|nr:uncharacterized protein LOC21388031 [Morus notabilis]XP_024028182.1 uncharacterized protein LOC21388031 [Morus notabilis]XP_024028183.1 uncharacterized protein LOC21388031 [Morus notabilis]XP_024028184.1 uncharacterized protein LOC21388031 [Morus notabilis]
MAASHSYYPTFVSNFSISTHRFFSQIHTPMFSFCFFFFFITSFSLFVFFAIYGKSNRKTEQVQQQPTHQTQTQTQTESDPSGKAHENDSAHLTRSLLLEILPSDSPKWETLFKSGTGNQDSDSSGSGFMEERDGAGGGDQRAYKKKKKRNKKKSANPKGEEGNSGPGCQGKEELVCLYPFTSSSSLTQRKIKQQYDELMKCHHSKGLTLAQVGQFANCLVEAKNELQHKADVIQRKFTITKALLFKADRSSFDRLRQQIYKLELEQKRLEEDAFVYNWLQQQLKLSPAYKKMLEIGTSMEMKAKSGELMESSDTEYSGISFEELLAQEKKDSFWQRNGKLRPCSS